MKKALIGILIIVVLGLGLVMGILLVGQKEIFKQKASGPSSTADVSITPASATYQINSVNPISVNFNTGGILISAINIKITFSNLAAKATNIQISQNLLSGGDWTCPTKNISDTGNTEEVDIGCTNTGSGYSNSSDTLLATFDFSPFNVPVVNPLIIGFDPQATTMTQKSDGSNIALSTASTGSYTITGSFATTPTPTSPTIITSPTATATTQATYVPLITMTPTASASSSPSGYLYPTLTPSPLPIPVTGFDTPTIILGGTGILLMIVAGAVLVL